MSSVVVQDRQPSSISESPSTSSYNIESQELIGLGPLRSASKLFIKQRIRASDICALLTGCEVSIWGILFRCRKLILVKPPSNQSYMALVKSLEFLHLQFVLH